MNSHLQRISKSIILLRGALARRAFAVSLTALQRCRSESLPFTVVHFPLHRMLSIATLCLVTQGVTAADYVVENFGIAKPLTSEPGDPIRGAKVMIEREQGNCLACHAASVDAEFFGTTGPSLVGVGARLSAAQLRLRVVDPKRINPATMMPAYYRSEGLNRVLPEFAGKTILSAQQVEDVVAFLATQKAAP